MLAKCIGVALLLTMYFSSSSRADEVNWSECKTLVGYNTYNTWYEYEKPLLPLLDDDLRHVTRRTSGDRLVYFNITLGLLAEYKGSLILSPEREPKGTGFFFDISITKARVYLETRHTENSINEIIKVNTVLDTPKPAAIYLTISDDTLELRHQVDSTPFLQYHDERFGDVKYFGLGSSTYNGRGHATLYYDC